MDGTQPFFSEFSLLKLISFGDYITCPTNTPVRPYESPLFKVCVAGTGSSICFPLSPDRAHSYSLSWLSECK